MPEYIPISKEQETLANDTDLVALLRSKGEALKRSGSEWLWMRHRGVTVRCNQWYSHYTQKGGCAIDFVREFFGMSYPDAVMYLLNRELPTIKSERKTKNSDMPQFNLPEANHNMRRTFAYLTKTRGIDRKVISHFASTGLIYEDAKYHNAVFVGRDEDGNPRHAHKKGTWSEGGGFCANVEGSNPRFSFHHVGDSDTVHVFESPVDFLSYITMNPDNWQHESYVALNGIAGHALMGILEQYPDIRRVVLCLDNDTAGLLADARLSEALSEKGDWEIEIRKPELKDWNKDLMAGIGEPTSGLSLTRGM